MRRTKRKQATQRRLGERETRAFEAEAVAKREPTDDELFSQADDLMRRSAELESQAEALAAEAEALTAQMQKTGGDNEPKQ